MAVLDYHTVQVTDVRWRPLPPSEAPLGPPLSGMLASSSRDRTVAIWQPLEPREVAT